MISNNNGVNVIKNDVKSDKKINVDCLIKKNTVVTAINIDTAKNNSSPIFSPRRIIDIADKCDMPIVLEGPEYHYISPVGFEKDPYVDYLFNKLGDRAKLTGEYDGSEEINKFSADVFPETDFETIGKEIFSFVDPIRHADGVIYEFIPKGSSKGDGIEMVCDKLGLSLSDTYAIGDSNNDLDMLERAGHGICMGGGSELAMKAGEYVTDTLENDGLYKALVHYGLIS